MRAAVADKVARTTGLVVDPDREVTVTCGATEAMIATLLATVNPGDEVVIFQPFYENYWPDTVLAGASPRFVTLHEPDWRIDPDELSAAFGEHTRAVVINTPNNPTGKVFSRDELELIGRLCERWNALAITDEIYEHLVYEGQHVYLAALPGLRERTVTISGIGKSYSVTGWRVGYAVAPPPLTDAIRKAHDFLTVASAGSVAGRGGPPRSVCPDSYYRAYLAEYRQRRDYLVASLRAAGFGCQPPAGAYYIMADISRFDFADDVALADYLVRERGLAVVPGTSFYPPPAPDRPDHRRPGSQRVRFSFPKRMETLHRATARLAGLPRRPQLATEYTESTEYRAMARCPCPTVRSGV